MSSPPIQHQQRQLLTISLLHTCAWLATFSVAAGLLHISRTEVLLTDILWPFALCVGLGAVVLSRSHLAAVELGALGALSRGLAITCFIYMALQLPDFTFDPSTPFWTPSLIKLTWIVTLIATLFAWRYAVLLIVPGVWLPWVKSLAGHLTGFEYSRMLDIQPLFQLALGAALASMVVGFVALLRWLPAHTTRTKSQWTDQLVFILVSFHLASYLMSGVAKIALDGGPLSWALENELRNIFFVGVVLQHLVWQDFPGAVSAMTQSFDAVGRLMSIIILTFQLAAITALASRRWAIALLLCYDVFHIGIFLTQGANFFSWVLVNLCLVAAIARLPKNYFGLKAVMISLALMLFCQMGFSKFYRVAALGWYDTLAVNDAHFVAYTAEGVERRVPNAFFGFYSYPISHMSFGYPEHGRYLPTGTNGGTDDSRIERLARDCSFTETDWASTKGYRWNAEAVSNLVRARHKQLVETTPGPLPWTSNVYWHHFWNPPSTFSRFQDLRLDEITGFRFVVDSYCLQVTGTGPTTENVSTAEFLIPLDQP